VDAAGIKGRVVIAGVCMAPDTIVPITAVMKEVQVRFAVFYRDEEFAAAAALLNNGGVDTGAFIASTVQLPAVQGAFEHLLSQPGGAGKTLVLPQTS
jgi:(R,R)-butanediol dehydrogenase/meso-butanediol dehydrogenase/diacetyl reductase